MCEMCVHPPGRSKRWGMVCVPGIPAWREVCVSVRVWERSVCGGACVCGSVCASSWSL